MTALRVGSLCTGFGALDLAIEDALGPTELVFVADPGSKIVDGRDGHPDRWDDGPVKLLAHRFPGVPNLGDISVVDWATVPPVDVLAAGFPCTDLSLAGKQEGLIPGNRSGVWFSVVRAIKELKPLMVIIENVGGLLSARAHSDVEPCPWCVGDEPGGANGPVLRALGCVLGDLANLGFDAEWVSVNASDVGAPHRRHRVFIVAWVADAAGDARRLIHRNLRASADANGGGRRPNVNRVPAGKPDTDRRGAGRDGLILLPTPTASEGTGAGHAAQGGRNLRTEVSLLPTPKASDSKRGDSEGERARKSPSLAAVGALLPTPRATDGTHGGPNQRGSSGDLMLPSAVALLPTPTATPYGHQKSESAGAAIRPSLNTLAPLLLPTPVVAHDARCATAGRSNPKPSTSTTGWTLADVVYDGRWGQYGPAIERWEWVMGRPAPEPTSPSRTGKPQLAAAFGEWLMGCAAGWITEVPGLTRNQMLRLIGNGVVWQQGSYAIRHLLVASGLLEQMAA